MRKELPKVYDPQAVENSIYQMWMDGNCFKADADRSKKPFTIVMPPLYDCNAATECNRSAAYGTCLGLHTAGYPDSL